MCYLCIHAPIPSNAPSSAGICSIIRTYELQALSSLNEYVYDTVPMLLWSSTEVFATIICACIPILRPLYVRIVHSSKYGMGSSGKNSYPLNEYEYGSAKKGDGSRGVFTGTERSMAGGLGTVKTTVRMGTDNVSEESILRDAKMSSCDGDEEGGIRRTDEIRVTSVAV